MAEIRLEIDGIEVPVPEGANLVAAARVAGIYVPTLCWLADLPPAPSGHACGVCVVTVEGEPEPVRACETPARAGARIVSAGEELAAARRAALNRILEAHPGVVPPSPRLSDGEFLRLVEFLGLPPDLVPSAPGEPRPDEDLCVVCGRCVRACEKRRGAGAIEIAEVEGRLRVRPKGGTLPASGCVHCGTCVEVCPTGARREAVPVCRSACPAGVDVPLCLGLVAEGRLGEAAAVVRNRVPLPSVLGSLCDRPCEDACRRGPLPEPVAIRDLERVAGMASDKAPLPASDTDRRVAVIGAGPAGLSAAWFLRVLGHAVTVFDAEEDVGGSLRNGIPSGRLPRDAIDHDLRAFREMGIAFATGARLGSDLDPAKVAAAHDAVVLATGAGRGRRLDLPGADLRGIATALGFLRSVASGSPDPDVADRCVLVIGGGGVAMDAATEAARAGAERVDLFSLEAEGDLPAHPAEVDRALAHGVRLHPGWGPSGYVARGDRVAAVDLVRCRSVLDGEGRFAPRYDTATAGRAPADIVLLAVGREPDPAIEECAATMGGTVVRAGGLEEGSAGLAWTVASGREAALAVHRTLGFSGEPREFVPEHPPAGRRDRAAARPRCPSPLAPEQAAEEAGRCLGCGSGPGPAPAGAAQPGVRESRP